MGTDSNQLAILREELGSAEKQFRTQKKPDIKVAIGARIKSLKGRIDNLGRRGELKMVIVVKKIKWLESYPHLPVGIPQEMTITETIFYHDLDDRSIFQLIEAHRKNNETILSKSIVGIPLGIELESSLKDNILSWVIN